MATLKEDKSHEMGLHEEQLQGRTQQRFFSVDESENLTYFHSFDVDTSKSASIDALDMTPREINREIRELMEKGIGNITVDNPMSRHGVGVGILNRLNLTFSDSLGYFGCGLIDGPNVHIKGRVGWSCAENMMAGTVVIDKNAGSTFGAAIRGGDLVCKGSVGCSYWYRPKRRHYYCWWKDWCFLWFYDAAWSYDYLWRCWDEPR